MMRPVTDAERDWFGAAWGILLTGLLVWSGRTRQPGVGSKVKFAVTVVPSDAPELECSSSEVFGGRRCGFDAEGLATAGDRPLRPYMTTYRQLVLLSGVFEESHVTAWLDEARRNDDNSRVTLRCDAVLLGTARSAAVRWQSASAFEAANDVQVGEVLVCRVHH